MVTKNKGFTLIELLVVIATIALPMGILTTALLRSNIVDKRMLCNMHYGNLKTRKIEQYAMLSLFLKGPKRKPVITSKFDSQKIGELSKSTAFYFRCLYRFIEGLRSS
jgi:prepilin-type N-terminal cleavage/methylation domain-containing protein